MMLMKMMTILMLRQKISKLAMLRKRNKVTRGIRVGGGYINMEMTMFYQELFKKS